MKEEQEDEEPTDLIYGQEFKKVIEEGRENDTDEEPGDEEIQALIDGKETDDELKLANNHTEGVETDDGMIRQC